MLGHLFGATLPFVLFATGGRTAENTWLYTVTYHSDAPQEVSITPPEESYTRWKIYLEPQLEILSSQVRHDNRKRCVLSTTGWDPLLPFQLCLQYFLLAKHQCLQVLVPHSSSLSNFLDHILGCQILQQSRQDSGLPFRVLKCLPLTANDNCPVAIHKVHILLQFLNWITDGLQKLV